MKIKNQNLKELMTGAKIGTLLGLGVILNVILLLILLYPNIPMILEHEDRWLGHNNHYIDHLDPEDPLVMEIANYIMLHNLNPEEYISSRIHWCTDFEAWGVFHYAARPYETVWAGCGDCLNRAILSASVTKRLEQLNYVENSATIEYQPYHAYTQRIEGDQLIEVDKINEEDLPKETILDATLIFWDHSSLGFQFFSIIGSLLIWITTFKKTKEVYNSTEW